MSVHKMITALTTKYASGSQVVDALVRGESKVEDPLRDVRSLSDLAPLGEPALRLLSGIWTHHVRGGKRPLDAPADSGRPFKRSRFDDLDGGMDRKHGGERKGGDDDAPPFDPQVMDKAKSSDFKPSGLPAGSMMYRSMLAYGRVIKVGDMVFIDDQEYLERAALAESEGVTPPPKPKALVKAMFKTKDGELGMYIAWCYTGLDMQDLPGKTAALAAELKEREVRDVDYVLSTHEQRCDLSSIHWRSPPANEPLVHDDLLFDPGRKTLIPAGKSAAVAVVSDDDDESDHDKADKDMMSTAFTGKNAFVDCLCASAELQHKTTFWRRAEDVILRPLKDHGQPDNKQRQVLADAKYEYEFDKIKTSVQTKCFCCDMKRMCAWQVRSLDVADVKYVGTHCKGRIEGVRDFMRAMRQATDAYRASHGAMDVGTLNKWYQTVNCPSSNALFAGGMWM